MVCPDNSFLIKTITLRLSPEPELYLCNRLRPTFGTSFVARMHLFQKVRAYFKKNITVCTHLHFDSIIGYLRDWQIILKVPLHFISASFFLPDTSWLLHQIPPDYKTLLDSCYHVMIEQKPP